MPDLSDTVAKCRMGTAKKFYTSIASLSHISKRSGFSTDYQGADGTAIIAGGVDAVINAQEVVD